MDAIIEFKNVHKSFGRNQVLCGLDLKIPKGKVTFILGKSGEGKSVTIKHIMGLMKPDRGSVLVNGKEVNSLSHEELRLHRRQFGMLFQHAALFDSLCVADNVMFPLKENTTLNPTEREIRMKDVLSQVGLKDIYNKYPSELSTGEKKRVGLARALSPWPSVVLYDEPTTGMDPLVSEMIDELIVDVNHNNPDLTSIVISHDLKAALATGQNVVMLYKGVVALEGPPEVFRSTKDPIVRQFFSGKVEGPMQFI